MPDPFTVSDWHIWPTPAGLSVTLTAADGRTVDIAFPFSFDAPVGTLTAADLAADLALAADQWAFDADS